MIERVNQELKRPPAKEAKASCEDFRDVDFGSVEVWTNASTCPVTESNAAKVPLTSVNDGGQILKPSLPKPRTWAKLFAFREVHRLGIEPRT
jgi:hypothetical protein